MKKAFTLIELLIVVAIIAILAAIAVPNFLEAQTRSKVSRAKADIRTLATGLEAYRIDNPAYPSGNPFDISSRRSTDPLTPQYEVLEKLSTPIAYVTSGLIIDPFKAKQRTSTIDPNTGVATISALTPAELEQEKFYKYCALTRPGSSNVLALVQNVADSGKGAWIAWSVGPTATKPFLSGNTLLGTMPVPTEQACLAWIYDPTNGTVSNGGIFRVGGTGLGRTDPGGMFVTMVYQSGK